jgi:two-component system, response regulator RegA
MNDGYDAPSVLLVDENDNLCADLARSFHARNFRTTVAHTGATALAAADSARPGYAVLELKLPDQSGLRVLERLLEQNPDIRVVVLTAHASISTAVEAIKLGAVHYLTKPASADEIVAALYRDQPDPNISICERPMSPSRVEWEYINRVLLAHRGNISATARALSLHRRTLQRKLAKHAVRT